MRIQETGENEMIEIAFLLTIIVCNSQGSKAFELATAYVQVKKGPKNDTYSQGNKCYENGVETLH